MPESGSDAPSVGEAPTEDGAVPLKAAALDAYRVSVTRALLAGEILTKDNRSSMTCVS